MLITSTWSLIPESLDKEFIQGGGMLILNSFREESWDSKVLSVSAKSQLTGAWQGDSGAALALRTFDPVPTKVFDTVSSKVSKAVLILSGTDQLKYPLWISRKVDRFLSRTAAVFAPEKPTCKIS